MKKTKTNLKVSFPNLRFRMENINMEMKSKQKNPMR